MHGGFKSKKSSFRGGCQAGVTLVEVMIAGTILAVVLTATATFLSYSSKSQLQNRGVEVRDRLLDELRKYGLSSLALRNSSHVINRVPEGAPDSELLGSNMVFAVCVDPAVAAANPTLRCPSRSPREFVLAGPAKDASGRYEKLAGTVANPVRYTEDGRRCPWGAAASGDCPLEALALFAATCQKDTGAPGGSPWSSAINCSNAPGVSAEQVNSVRVGIVVRNARLGPTTFVKRLSGGAPFAARSFGLSDADAAALPFGAGAGGYSPGGVLAAFTSLTNETIDVSVMDASTLNRESCPTGAQQTGTDGQGQPICTCKPPYRQQTQSGVPVWETGAVSKDAQGNVTGGNRRPVCELPAGSSSCAAGQTLQGFDANGQAVCKNFTGPCWVSASSSCGDGQWLRSQNGPCYQNCVTSCGKSGCTTTCSPLVCSLSTTCCTQP